MITECIEDSGTGPAPERVEEIVSRFYREYDIPDDHRLNIVFMSNDDIREYTKRLFGIDMETDVISVIMDEEFDGEYLWGEIYVSSETAQAESEKRRSTRDDELMLYIVHGLFHLIGYDDATDAQRQEMWDLQVGFLGSCGYDPDTFSEGS